MNNLLNLNNVIPPDPDKNTQNSSNYYDEDTVNVKYWAFGAKWEDLEPEDIDAMSNNEDELDSWLRNEMKPDIELAESILACMIIKNDPDNGNYTIALWNDGNIAVEPNDNEEKRSTEHAGEIVSSDAATDFFQRAFMIIEHAIKISAIIIDKYNEQAKNAGIDLAVLGNLTADPDVLMAKIKNTIAVPKENLI